LTTARQSTYVDGVKGTTKLANAAGSRDPAVGLRAVASLRQLVEELQELQVTNARTSGWSWQEIADALGVSKQAVHKKYAGRRLLGRGR
jgi:DNA-directed RNA polymerase specialized sigma24 family protein